jgi:hypothetical protein
MVYLLERQYIESIQAEMIAENLKDTYKTIIKLKTT